MRLKIYGGALVTSLRIFDWSICIYCVFDFLAVPQSRIPYIQRDLKSLKSNFNIFYIGKTIDTKSMIISIIKLKIPSPDFNFTKHD